MGTSPAPRLCCCEKMPAFCLGCLGCLKCLVPSFVPALASLAVTFFMDLPTPVIALLLAFIFSLPFLKQLLLNSSTPPSKAPQVSQGLQRGQEEISETKPESSG